MKIKDSIFEKNFKKYINHNFFLFYGPNFGKVDAISSKLSKEFTENQGFIDIISCDNDSISKDPHYISDHINSHDIFSKKKLLLFSSQNSEKLEKVLKFNYKNLTDFKMIIKMGELNKKSKLRNTFEKNENIISIPCYEDSIFECKKIILERLKSENLYLSDQQLHYLSISLRKNRGFIYNEIEKLILYLKKKETISDIQLKVLISNSSSYELENFIYETVSGKITKFDKIFCSLKKNGINDLTILNMLVKHFFKILYSKEQFKVLGSYSQSIKTLYPPIFFKFESEFIEQVKIWPKRTIEIILGRLLEAEKKIKKNAKKSEYLTKFLIFSVTKIGNKLHNKKTI